MKWLLGILIAGNLNAASYCVNADSSALLDMEQVLVSYTGNYDGTAVGSPTYITTGAWNGSYAIQSPTNSDYFTLPITSLGAAAKKVSGTVELSIRTGSSVASQYNVFALIDNTGAPISRQVCLYIFNSQFYMLSEGVYNTAVTAAAADTNYYFKVAWDTTATKIYSGTWTVPRTVTLTLKSTLAAPQFNNNTFAFQFMTYLGANHWTGQQDWVRIKPTADFSTTVTVDPPCPSMLSPYMKGSTSNKMMPLLFMFFDLFTTKAWAVNSDTRLEGRRNSDALGIRYEKIEAARISTAIAQRKITVTPTPTPTNTPSRAFTATPTPDAVMIQAQRTK